MTSKELISILQQYKSDYEIVMYDTDTHIWSSINHVYLEKGRLHICYVSEDEEE